eukprot:gene3164-1468_t
MALAKPFQSEYIEVKGTLWCGIEDIADNEDALGRLDDVDSCCRNHDHCDRSVSAHTTKFGYTNEMSTTVSDCECDTTFYNCLKAVTRNENDAKVVGRIYFNFKKMPCLQFSADGTVPTLEHSPKF